MALNPRHDAQALIAAADRRCPKDAGFGHQSIPLLDLADDLGWGTKRAMDAVDRLCATHNDRVETGLGEPAELITIDCCRAHC